MKVSIPRGTRDFGPAEMKKRNYLLQVLRKNFELFGFACIETPAMENISTLTGKYGDEGDQLIFKILNSRIHESKEKDKLRSEFELSLQSARNSEELTEKALRYDLTVPFARFVTMNRGQLTFPFRRYQVQPVWRADRPQKGRYREFTQCDADIIGSTSLSNELDLIALMDKSFKELHLPVVLKFNNRKVLSALAEVLDEKERLIDITVAIDKLDKIGREGVTDELRSKGVKSGSIERLDPLLSFTGSNEEKLDVLRELIEGNATGSKGIEEIEYILRETKALAPEHLRLELDITLARGLNYYTGSIFEVKALAGSLTSSVLGGGRYDDLTGVFGLADMSGVGISFGVDRIYDLMEELALFPGHLLGTGVSTVLFAHFDEQSQLFALRMANDLRKNDISAEIFPDTGKKLGKQFEYADKKKIPFVCTVGSEEMESGVFSLKHMSTGVQQKLNHKDMIEYIKLNS